MALLDILLPPACAACGRLGAVLCDACVRGFPAASNHEDRFIAADAGVVVGDQLTLAVAAFAYDGSLRRALQRLKYAGAARVAAALATAALPRLEALLAITGPVPLVPIPLHRERERERGYNQAALLADRLGASASLPVAAALVRERATTKQHRLDRAARLQNLVAAFAVAPDARVPPVAILVDDILTTSATMEACSSVLRAAGSERVYGFAIAREV